MVEEKHYTFTEELLNHIKKKDYKDVVAYACFKSEKEYQLHKLKDKSADAIESFTTLRQVSELSGIEVKKFQNSIGNIRRSGYIKEVHKEGREVFWGLTDEGRNVVDMWIDEFNNLQEQPQQKTTSEPVINIERFRDFIESHQDYHSILISAFTLGKRSITVDFMDVAKFNHEFADELLENPEEMLKVCEIAAEQFSDDAKNIRVRFDNLPQSCKVPIGNIRSKTLGKFVTCEGIIRVASEVRPQATAARFECPACGNFISVLQLDSTFKEPTFCPCGRKGKFRLDDKELVDAQHIELEECPDDVDVAQPKRVRLFVKEDLCDPDFNKSLTPGSRIRVIGFLKEIPIFNRNGRQTNKFDYQMQVNSIIPLDDTEWKLVISDDEQKQIEKIASGNKHPVHVLANSVAPDIYGHDDVKKAMLLQRVSGVKKFDEGGNLMRRDKIHLLLCGDPGLGKSVLLKNAQKIHRRFKRSTGRSGSGVGLTATVRKDEVLKSQYALEAGAMVLANGGLLAIDEVDKMRDDDADMLNEGMEQQTISVSKANVQAVLKTDTSVLAVGNPRNSRFDGYSTVYDQIGLKPTLLNRFDLIFVFKDLPKEDADRQLAKFVLDLHTNGKVVSELSLEFLRKYLHRASQVRTKLGEHARLTIEEYYVNLRKVNEGKSECVPVNARILEGIIRLSEACAKLRLSDEVSEDDVKIAIGLVTNMFEEIGVMKSDGSLDIDVLACKDSSSQRVVTTKIRGALQAAGDKGIFLTSEDLAEQVSVDRDTVEVIMKKLSKAGVVYEPKSKKGWGLV